MAKARKGKSKVGTDAAQVKEAPVPLPPPPPAGRSPAAPQHVSFDDFALPGSLLDEGAGQEQMGNQAAGWGNENGDWPQEDGDDGDGWGNDNGGGWDTGDGQGDGDGELGHNDEDQWRGDNGKGGGGGWGDETREQSEGGWGSERDMDQSWAQPARPADPRRGQAQNQIASQSVTMNTGRDHRSAPGRAPAWGQQAVPAMPRAPTQQSQPRHAPAAQSQTPGWSNWAAEAQRASRAGIVPSSGGGWASTRPINPPPAAGWGSIPAQNSHARLVSQPNLQHGQRADVTTQQRAQIQGLLGRSFQQGFPPQQMNSIGQFDQAPQPQVQKVKHREQEHTSQHHFRGRGHQRFQGWDDITEETEEEEEEDEKEDMWGDVGEDHFLRTPKSPGRSNPLPGRPSSPGPGRLTSVLSSVLGPQKLGISYPMPSRTMAIAAQGGHPVANGNFTQDRRNSQQPVRFSETKGAAIAVAYRALYSLDRKAKDRIFWAFSPHKDERVASALSWIDAMSQGLATFGLQKFLDTRERGALFTNAGLRQGESTPAFDWMTFDQLQATRDQTIQESVAYYDPAIHVIVFVFLLSPSGNSMAMWRRKLNVPNNLRLRYTQEIQLAKSALRNVYEIHVDELPYDGITAVAPEEPPPPPPKKKKRGFWSRLKFW